ncbi:DUF3788 domain-containing protein [Flavobacterium terrisoli]|uniref:DUF3788 domain-containing protein n=1 Tax=Flavobacterium terrisoli TaxID=3242195 RepID=UPI0025432BC9|nr:DUF3788 domain-containing protein [Flavobacterium buctense]
MKSVFTDKNITPTNESLKEALGENFEIWEDFVDFTIQSYPGATQEWNFSGEKFGWSFRIKDKKRVLIYLLPRDGYFKTAFVFGQKATDQILESTISETIKNELRAAKAYAEGRGIRIDIKDKSMVEDIHQLITIKILN